MNGSELGHRGSHTPGVGHRGSCFSASEFGDGRCPRRTSRPGRPEAPQEDVFFNSIATATDDRVRRSTFDIDYVATIPIEGGASLRMVATDPSCLMIKNCADPETSVCTPHSFANLSSQIADDVGTQPYNGQFLGLRVQQVTRAP